jgi:hypothetical protein
MAIRDLVGRRVLARLHEDEYGVDEYEIAEVSPSGKMVKLTNLEGYARWYETRSVLIDEVLEDKPNRQMQELETVRNMVANDIEFAKSAKKLIDSVFKGEGY